MMSGTKWGFLECVGVKTKVMEDAGGAVQETNSRGSEAIWQLECACGYKFEMDAAKFPGKKNMRSCGRKGCEFGQGGGQAGSGQEVKRLGRPVKSEGRKAAVSVYLPIAQLEWLDGQARDKGVGLSEVVSGLVQVGMREEQR